jgi:hypothetical protein
MKIWFGIALSLYVICSCMRRPSGCEAGSSSIEAAVLAALYELKIKFGMLAAPRGPWIDILIASCNLVGGPS